MRKFLLGSLSLILLGAVAFSGVARAQEQVLALDKFVYLPMVSKGCSATGQTYGQGIAEQFDTDDPVRPASLHADKNLKLRSYTVSTQLYTPSLVDYGPGSEDPSGNTPPQFATLFNPARSTISTASSDFYQVYNWNYVPSSQGPGTRGTPITERPVTALGLPTTAGELLYTPSSSYVIAPGYQAMVLYADADSITFIYTTRDSTAPQTGYAIFIQNICTDPNLVALYNSLDNSSRNTFIGQGARFYNLPYLAIGQPFGTAKSNRIIVVIKDGSFEDPRSCQGWWINRPNGPNPCPVRNGSTIFALP